MAKQLVNPLERHAEKAVLGLAGLILLGVIAKYIVTSPNQVDLGGEPVVPSTVDDRVAKKAETVRQALKAQAPRLPEFTPVIDTFAKQVRPITTLALGSELPAAQTFSPDVPRIDAVTVTTDKAKLVEVVQLGKPKLTSGRMLKHPNAGGQIVDWVTVSSVFDRKTQTERQQRMYGGKWADVIFGPAELQRRERRPDGSWSDEDWVAITSQPAARLATPPPVPLTEESKQVTVKKDDYNPIEKFNEALAKPLEQLALIRPLPYPEENPTWKFPILTSMRDVAVQEDEYLNPNEANPSTNPPLIRFPWLDDAPAKTGRGTAVPPKDLPSDDDPKKLVDALKKRLEDAKKSKNEAEINSIIASCEDILKVTTLSPSVSKDAEKVYEQAKTLAKDIKYAGQGGEGDGKGEGSAGRPKRELGPNQQIWAHDAQQGSLVNGRTYQFRIRPSILNRVVGLPEKFENPQDAVEFFIKGEWSEPSDPVTLEKASQFYVVKSDESKADITLEVYQWFRGVWVTSKQKLKTGQPVAWEDRVSTPDPQNPLEVYKAPVRFAPDVTIVDVDFNRRARERKVEKGGVKIQPPEKTASVVFIDAAGRLQERFENLDRNDPARKDLRDRVWKEPKAGSEP